MERPDASDIINTLDAVVNRTKENELEAMQDLWAARNFSAVYDSLETEKEVSELSMQFDSSLTNRAEFQKSNRGGFPRSIPSQDNNRKPHSSSVRSSDNISTSSAPSMDRSFCQQPSQPKLYPFHEVSHSAPMAVSSKEKSIFKILDTNSNESVRVDFRDERLSPNRKCHETRLGEFDFNGVESLEFKPESVVTIDEALDCHNSGRRQQSFEAFRTLANGNDPKAHYYLGYYYFWGQDGVCEKDWGKALYHFEIASQANDSDALDHLGIYYSDEQNPNKNLVKAFEFYKRSAEHGNKKGYYHLGVCYAKGRGTSINKELALANIKEAANRGHSLAIEQLNRSRLR